MPLHILYVAYPLLTVSNESAGGAEQVLWTLEWEMAQRGMETVVAASAGSQVSGELFSTGGPCTRTDDYERRLAEHESRIVEFVRQSEEEGKPFDLIHDMSGSFWRRTAGTSVPVLATLHLPRSFYAEQSFQDIPANVKFNCVSAAQSQSFADMDAMLGVVPNGIPVESFAYETLGPANESATAHDPAKRAGLLWLGRICEEKAPHLALEIAGRAGLPITLAGQVYPFSYHQQYFAREVAPRLRQVPNATFISAPSFAHKRQLLRQAKALLITSLAEETSSLVAMEAAASGTPVVAFRRGALPEVVRDHVTGYVVDDAAGAVDACRRLGAIASAACMAYARKNFSSARMAEDYAQLYARIFQSATERPAGATGAARETEYSHQDL
ncbi:MAG TPA: glycosyltransferase [Candidatus Angelobacter sp.]|nr:glycosyltransferase [Candidatus Angelobacter sp.]